MSAIYLVVAFAASLPEVDGDRSDARPAANVEAHSADQLARILSRHHDALRAISLVYRSVRSVKGEPEGNYWRRAISVDGAGMFKSDNSHGHKRLPWYYDPKRKSLVVTPTESTVLSHLNRSVITLDSNSDEALKAVQSENIFYVLCWWPFADWPPPELFGHVCSMSALLKEKSYRVMADNELIRSKPCYRFMVNNILTVWCDRGQPECILRSERYDPANGSIESVFEMVEYEEVGDDIWLPKKFRIVRFDSHAHTPQLRKRIVYDNTFLVSDVRINEDVGRSDFQQNFPPGSVREVSTEGATRYKPIVDGQLHHFESIVNWCRLGSSQADAVRPSHWSDCFSVFALSALFGCGAMAVIVAARHVR